MKAKRPRWERFEWTSERRKLFGKLWKQGKSADSIASILGTERGKILSMRVWLGFPRRRRTQQNHSLLRTAFNRLFMQYKYHAKLGFALSRGEFWTLITAPCTVCGRIASCCKKSATVSQPYNTIDRIDSRIGYYLFNCQTLCWLHNHMKQELSQEEFRFGLRYRLAQEAGFYDGLDETLPAEKA